MKATVLSQARIYFEGKLILHRYFYASDSFKEEWLIFSLLPQYSTMLWTRQSRILDTIWKCFSLLTNKNKSLYSQWSWSEFAQVVWPTGEFHFPGLSHSALDYQLIWSTRIYANCWLHSKSKITQTLKIHSFGRCL